MASPSMELSSQQRLNWRTLFAQKSFRFFFVAMFVSLFGTGMNFAGVTWYVLQQTNSTVKVSLIVTLVTLPGLVVPFFGGVLIDRVDRRYLGIILDLCRAVIVLATAALIYTRAGGLWSVYVMVFLLGVGFAIYWATINALVQEVIPREMLVTANATVLIAVQSGMMTAGAFVGFTFEIGGLPLILAFDGATYLISALCLTLMRRGYVKPGAHSADPAVTLEAPAGEPPALAPVEADLTSGFLRDVKEGLRYLREQPRVLAIGVTYSCMMAGVLSGNVLVVALARDILNAGARGFGYLEAGWAVGAIVGGLSTGVLTHRFRQHVLLVLALSVLAVGHALFPYVSTLAVAVAMNALFGTCRALGGVLTQSTLMMTVPKALMGRTQSAFTTISTVMQVAMSLSLGWLAQGAGLGVAFGMLGLLYAGAVLAALRATRFQVPPSPAR